MFLTSFQKRIISTPIPPPAKKNAPFFSKWTILNDEASPVSCEDPARDENADLDATTQKKTYVERQKSNLIGRLFKNAIKGKYELWHWTGDRIVDPPGSDLQAATLVWDPAIQSSQPAYQTVFWWARMTCIYKSDLTKFCRDLRIHAKFEDAQASPQVNGPEQGNNEFRDKVISQSIKADFTKKPAADSQKTIGTVFSTEEITDVPLGKQRWRITQLAIEAAWELEKILRRPASPAETIEKLQEWAKIGDKDGCLRAVVKNGVMWLPKKNGIGKEKLFDVEACGKALDKWRNSRAMLKI